MFQITLGAEQIEAARVWGETIENIVASYGPNYTGLCSPRRYMKGRIGELAFVEFCQFFGLMFRETSNCEGRPDEQDFLLWTVDGQRKRVDIKTSFYRDANELRAPQRQADRHGTPDLIVAATGSFQGVDSVSVHIVGAASRKRWLTERQPKTDGYDFFALPFSRLDVSTSTIIRSCLLAGAA